jgi:hypothetical protein
MQRSNATNRVSAMLLMGVLALAGAGCGKSKAQLDADELARQKSIALAVEEQQRADRDSTQAALAEAKRAFDAAQGTGSEGCPPAYSGLRSIDVPKIAACRAIHKDVCQEVCGARYDTLEVRNFVQTGHNAGLLCLDTSMAPMKNGVSFVEDPGRASCLEVHEGTFRWCTNFNKSVNGVDFGAYVQCHGQIAK